MVIANQKSTIDTHTKRKKNPNTTLKLVIKSQEKRKKEEGKETYKNKSETINKMAARTYISVITLNIYGLNAPTKRHRLAEWIQKQDLYVCCLQETHCRSRETYRLKVRGWKKVFHANGNQKKTGLAICISDKIDFKIKTLTREIGRASCRERV